jgi:hypothetical protein
MSSSAIVIPAKRIIILVHPLKVECEISRLYNLRQILANFFKYGNCAHSAGGFRAGK